MPEYIKGRPTLMRCVFENAIKNFQLGEEGQYACFRLEHDGQTPTKDSQASNPKFFTRSYRLWLDGKPAAATVDFRYDYRTGHADFGVSYKHIAQLRKVMEMSETKGEEIEL